MDSRIDENELSIDSSGAALSEEENDLFEDETVDEKRIRLSKQYLAEIEGDNEQKKLVISEDLNKKSGKQIQYVADWYAEAASDSHGESASETEDSDDETTAATTAKSHVQPKKSYGRLGSPEFRKGHLRSCTSVCVRKDGQKIYSGGKDCAILEWDLESGKKVVFSGARKSFDCGGHFEQVLSVAYCDKMDILISVGIDSLVRLWDPRSPKACVDTLRGHNKAITKVVCEPDSTTFYTASEDRLVKLWDLQHRAVLDTYLGHTEPIVDMDIFQKGKPITGSADKTARFWKTMRDSHLVFNKHSGAVDAVTALQSETYVTGGQDGNLHVWSADCGRPIASVSQAHGSSWISALSCHRNSDFVMSGASDGFVRCWKLTSSNAVSGSKKRKRAENMALQPLQCLPISGVINQIAESERYWVCAVGQEHRLGRWERHAQAKHGISIIRKPRTS